MNSAELTVRTLWDAFWIVFEWDGEAPEYEMRNLSYARSFRDRMKEVPSGANLPDLPAPDRDPALFLRQCELQTFTMEAGAETLTAFSDAASAYFERVRASPRTDHFDSAWGLWLKADPLSLSNHKSDIGRRLKKLRAARQRAVPQLMSLLEHDVDQWLRAVGPSGEPALAHVGVLPACAFCERVDRYLDRLSDELDFAQHAVAPTAPLISSPIGLVDGRTEPKRGCARCAARAVFFSLSTERLDEAAQGLKASPAILPSPPDPFADQERCDPYAAAVLIEYAHLRYRWGHGEWQDHFDSVMEAAGRQSAEQLRVGKLRSWGRRWLHANYHYVLLAEALPPSGSDVSQAARDLGWEATEADARLDMSSRSGIRIGAGWAIRIPELGGVEIGVSACRGRHRLYRFGTQLRGIRERLGPLPGGTCE